MWNYGYISEVDYIHGYFSELSPARMKLALLSRGIAHSVGRSPSYLELGFGQGLTLNIHAATNSGHFYGTDFNPSQVANAAELAAAVGKQVTIWEDSFEDLAARDDLPQFDIVALHGIWSWVSDETRAAIQSIARHYLKPGGILYVSHNILPGWSPMMPLRHLLDEYSRRAATGGILSRVDQSLDFAEKLMSAGASYFKANPGVADRLKAMRKQDRSYVSHEYFNRHWNPETFASTSDALAECKLTYAASASLIDNIDSVAVPPRARPLLASISDDVLRETTRDYVLNQQFRRDLFIKGARRMTAAESAMQFDAMQFLAAGPLDEVPSRVATPMGEVNLKPEIYAPLHEALVRQERKPFTLAGLRDRDGLPALNDVQLREALLILCATGHVSPVSDSETPAEDREAARRLNREICSRARFTGGTQYLAAPVTGAGVFVNRLQQLILLAMDEGREDIDKFVWECFSAQNERLIVEGKTLEGEEANRAHIARARAEFAEKILPTLIAVGAVQADAPFGGHGLVERRARVAARSVARPKPVPAL